MRLSRILTGTLFAVATTAALTLTAFAAPPKGRIQSVSENQIVGWAYDEDTPNSPVVCEIAVINEADETEVLRQTLTAGEYREKLEQQGKGNGWHGFTMEVDFSSLPIGYYRIEGQIGEKAFSNTMQYTNGDPEAEAQRIAQEAEKTAAQPTLTSLGHFKLTGYCPCKQCSAGWGRGTCTGAVATANHTIAVDPKVIPLGTQVMINGVVYTAEDRGGGVKGKHIDIFFDTHAETANHTGGAEVFLVQ